MLETVIFLKELIENDVKNLKTKTSSFKPDVSPHSDYERKLVSIALSYESLRRLVNETLS